MTETNQNRILHGDSVDLIRTIESESVHLILSDIPYGIGADDWDVLHDNTNSAFLGSSPAQEKAGAIFKKRGKPLNGWSEADRQIPIQYYEWCSTWVAEWYRVLKPGASAIIFAGRRLAHRAICAFEDAGFTYKDMLAWLKERAPHRAQRLSIVYDRRGDKENAKRWDGWRVGNLRPVFEPILWFTKPYKIGGTIADNALDYEVGGFNEAAFLQYVAAPDNAISLKASKEASGLHPTQKPVNLMQALIELTTLPGQLVLDPFCGSGSTLVAAAKTKREYVGIELDSGYFNTALERLNALHAEEETMLFK